MYIGRSLRIVRVFRSYHFNNWGVLDKNKRYTHEIYIATSQTARLNKLIYIYLGRVVQSSIKLTQG